MSKHKKQNTSSEELEEERTEQVPQDACESEPETSTKAEEPDYRDQYVRLYAEFDNFRKRTEREKAALIAYGKKDFALKMLPMYEVLLRQQKTLQEQKEQEQQDQQQQQNQQQHLLHHDQHTDPSS